MPYRDPAQRAAWMREYRKRKRLGQMSAPVAVPSTPSIVRAPERSSVLRRIVERAGPQLAPANTGFVLRPAGSSFKSALELARPFPNGILASRVCPYCYRTGD